MKKICLGIIGLIITIVVGFGQSFAIAPPTFERGFVEHIKNDVYQLKVNDKISLKDNIRCLFYPNGIGIKGCGENAGQIRDILRYSMIGIIFLFLVLVGVRLLISNPDSEKDKIKEALKSLYYIAIGGLLFFGAVWITNLLLPTLGGAETTGGASGELVKSLQGGTNSLFFKVISLLKILIFFIAIIMMVVYGFKIMMAADKAEEAKKNMRGIINVIIGLVMIKIIDYLYYIAQQKTFVSEAGNVIISIAKILGFFVGAGAVLMVFYAGYLFLTDQGVGEKIKKAKNIFLNILLVIGVIFILLLILYQIFNEFA